MGSKIDVMKGGDERILLPLFLSRGKDVHVFQYRFSVFEPGTMYETNVIQPFFGLWLSLAILIYGLQPI
jgi:hypothetical protein